MTRKLLVSTSIITRLSPRFCAISYSTSMLSITCSTRYRPFDSSQRKLMRPSRLKAAAPPFGIRAASVLKSRWFHVTMIAPSLSPAAAMMGSGVSARARSRTCLTSWPRSRRKIVTDSGTFSSMSRSIEEGIAPAGSARLRPPMLPLVRQSRFHIFRTQARVLADDRLGVVPGEMQIPYCSGRDARSGQHRRVVDDVALARDLAVLVAAPPTESVGARFEVLSDSLHFERENALAGLHRAGEFALVRRVPKDDVIGLHVQRER